jgi:predicted aldo/keto reductase-like oxidoreductase
MQYRKMKDGTDVSILGYGCMRFPRSLGQIDRAETEKQLLYAFEQGVNYFDTAYRYTGSEDTL